MTEDDSSTWIEEMEPEIPELDIDSLQQWISTKDYLPKWGGKGNVYGYYLCAVTEEFTDGLHDIFYEMKLCYWNDCANKFQYGNAFVDVKYWLPLPQLPTK